MTHNSQLTEIIRAATHSGDMAAITGNHRTRSDMVHAAVDAAIRGAIINGILTITPDAQERLDSGYQVWPAELAREFARVLAEEER